MIKKWAVIATIGVVIVGMNVLTVFADEKKQIDPASFSETPAIIASIALPKIEDPSWLTKQNEAEKQAQQAMKSGATTRTFTYDVTTRGAISANFSDFQTLANQSLNDARGWARLGVKFVQVPNGGDFTLVLSEASQLPTFSSGCSADYSCRAGRYVVINQDRWQTATPSWNTGGGSLRDYRHMVVNHETGHWLGHDHSPCGGAGQLAPVMQQQSIDLQGCSFNPWPLNSELTTTR